MKLTTAATPILLLAGILPPAWGQGGERPKGEGRIVNVRFLKVNSGPSYSYLGVVDEIDDTKMKLRTSDKGKEEITVELFPIDLLAEGKMVRDPRAGYAYRWQDVKKGDRVDVVTMQDDQEKKQYCMMIQIEYRPGAKLPLSQKPKEDTNYPMRSLFNDIDNGWNVSDGEIMAVFPPQPEEYWPSGRLMKPARPGGLDKEWQAKLDAIRAKKKEAELKAKPPEKK
ncbi:MAG: hypothetical protein MUF18_07895 [Fimbriiglobus sp.]|jgi:hypothetical protein|nr:hypothetical protein [Fimbriiglobus sp.]